MQCASRWGYFRNLRSSFRRIDDRCLHIINILLYHPLKCYALRKLRTIVSRHTLLRNTLFDETTFRLTRMSFPGENLLFRPKCLLQPIHLGCRRHIRLYIPPLNTINELPKDFSGGPSIFYGYPSHVHLTTRAHSDDLLSKARAGSLYFESSPKESLNPCKSGRTKFLLCDREKRRGPSELPCANCTRGFTMNVA